MRSRQELARENGNFSSVYWYDVRRHHRMNLPNSTFPHVLSAIRLIFGRVPDIPKCLSDYCDDRRLVDRKFSRRTNVQRKSCSRPTKNSCANLTPLRLCRYFTDNDSRVGFSGICQRNVKITVVSAFTATTRPVSVPSVGGVDGSLISQGCGPTAENRERFVRHSSAY